LGKVIGARQQAPCKMVLVTGLRQNAVENGADPGDFLCCFMRCMQRQTNLIHETAWTFGEGAESGGKSDSGGNIIPSYPPTNTGMKFLNY